MFTEDVNTSTLHRPAPVKRQQSVSKLAHRSHSIVDILKAVEGGNSKAIGPDAYLPKATTTAHSNERSPHSTRTPPKKSQEELFRASSFVQQTSYFDELQAAVERQRELDRNVIQFPYELRGENRFYNRPELGQKAAALVLDSRRPSSLFSDGISEGCREELNTFNRIKKFEHIKLKNLASTTKKMLRAVSPSQQSQRETLTAKSKPPPANHTRGGGTMHSPVTRHASFRPVAAFGGGGGEENDSFSKIPRPLQLSALGRSGAAASPSLPIHTFLHDDDDDDSDDQARQLGGLNAPKFLVHVSNDKRDELEEQDKFGRRVEYGRMVGMFREEILASRGTSYDKVTKHREVEGRSGVQPEVVLCWNHMDLSDPMLLMDVVPRGGVVLLSNAHHGRETRKVITAAKPLTEADIKQTMQGGANQGRPRSGDEKQDHHHHHAHSGGGGGAGGRASTPNQPKGKSQQTSAGKPSTPVMGATKGCGGGATPGTPQSASLMLPPAVGSSTSDANGKQRRTSSSHGKPPAGKNRAASGGGDHTSSSTAANNRSKSVVTISSPNPEDNRTSPMWQLKYCFCDDDAEHIIDIKRKMVVVETGGTKYAFDANKKHVSRDLEQESELQLSAAKRERLRWLRMTPQEREARRIHNLLSCGRAYEGRHVNLSHNAFQTIDVMITNTLAVLLRWNVTKLDLSFNQIETIDWSFLHVNQQQVDERKRRTMIDAEAHEEEEMRNATLTSSGLLSEAQTIKQRAAFLELRRRAIQDLVPTNAASKLFHHLQTLYLHGNPLRDLSELWKLEPLRNSLTYLTFHGQHHVDVQAKDPKNRAKLLAMFPKLVQLNFTTLLASDELDSSLL